jgi:hypothetical protein
MVVDPLCSGHAVDGAQPDHVVSDPIVSIASGELILDDDEA